MNLPRGWVKTNLGEIVEPIETDDPTKRPTEEFRYVDIGSIDNRRLQIVDPKTIVGRDAPSRARRLIRAGDVLFSTVRPYLRNIATVPAELDGGFTSTGICVLRPSENIESGFVFRRVISQDFIDAMTLASDGTMYPAIADRDVLAGTIVLPPAAEQRRIVAKLDVLTARIARAREDLDSISELAADFKQSTLATAFRGGLVRSKRESGPSNWSFEPASSVCAKVQSGGTPKAGFSVPKGVPFLKVYNLVQQQIDFDSRPQYVSVDVNEHELKKSIAYPGDVVMNIVGPPLGKVAIIPDKYPQWNLNQALTLFRPSDRITSKWIYYYLLGGESVRSIINQTRGIVGQVNISLSQCRNFILPIPPIDEQNEIIQEIEAAFARADRLEAEATRARVLLDRLESAVLSKAFKGELVPQDPNDEPASVLLDRIRAQRAFEPKERQKPRNGRRATA